ncbi:MAG: GNAT family N-acetyltransferase [Planctomycetota bacterium]|jgi:predicted N-acetyltransferase YhbS
MKVRKEQLVLIRPVPKRHAEAIFDLTGKTFGDYWNWVARCRQKFIVGDCCDWRASTIGLIGEKVVTHWGIRKCRMRIGRAVVRVAGVGDVATHGEMRRRGLMARTAIAGVEATRQAGYDMSLLFGLSDFYHRFGFVSAWPSQRYVVAAERLPAGPPGVKLRKVPNIGRPDLARLYNRFHARLTGTAVRGSSAAGKGLGGYVWTDRAGRAAGYVCVRVARGAVDCVDAAGQAEQVLRVLSSLARRHKVREVCFGALHYDSDLAKLLRRSFCRLEIQYAASGGAMIRTLNLASTLRKISSQLSWRLKHSDLAGWRGKLLVADPRERVVLRINRSKVEIVPAGGPFKHAIRGGEEIAQLLIGADEPKEVAETGKMRLTGDAPGLINVMFPNQHPMLAAPDRF